MVVGESVVAITNAPIGQTAQQQPTPTSLPVTACVSLDIAAAEATSLVDNACNVPGGDDCWRDGHVIHDHIAMEEEESPWEEWEEPEEGEESADGLSLVGSVVDCPPSPPLIQNGHRHNGHTPVITDLSDGDLTSLEEGEYDIGYTPTSLTGETQTQVPPAQLCLVTATVTGFTTEKGQQQNKPNKQEQKSHLMANGHDGGHPDMVFIVELTWSDGRVNVVTRTYTDFCRLQYYLINEFVDVPANESPARLNIYLPVRRDTLPEDSFAQAHAEPGDSILLAESRELLLNQYVQELIKLPPKISASPTALTFFESRNSDPVPYHETVDTSRVNVTDQYVLCWI